MEENNEKKALILYKYVISSEYIIKRKCTILL